jgi:hypothetical protein
MKTRFTILNVLLAVALTGLISCGGDDEPALNVLVTSSRTTGQFYTVDVKTGEKTEAFVISYNGNTLTDIRGFVYHSRENMFYVTSNSYEDLGDGNQNGKLYKVNPSTKVATLINPNDGDGGSYDVWDAIVNWAVAADDSLVGVGDFNSDGNGFVKFGKNGARSLKTVEADVCCGLGMIYNAKTKEALIGNDPNDGEVFIQNFNTLTGAALEDFTFTTFTGFPSTFNDIRSSSWLPLKGLATNPKDKEGIVYGLVFNYDENPKKTYFVSLDFNSLTVNYISTIGSSEDDQYNALTFIPKSKAK